MDNSPTDLTYTDEENDLENRSNQSYKVFDTGVIPSDVKLSPDRFEDFKKTVFKSRPNIGGFYQNIGHTPLHNYARTHTYENRNKVAKVRRAEFVTTFKEEVRKVLGSEIAESVAKQLKDNHGVSTVQHYSPLGHPDTLNATLTNALPYFGMNQPFLKNVIVLPCAGVSFNNTKFPRGHLFHTKNTSGEISTEQLTFFGHTVDARPVLHHAPYNHQDIIDAKNSLTQLVREGKLGKDQQDKLVELVDEIYGSIHALSADDYVDQLTITNYWLFKKLFENYNRPTPNLVYLAQEKVVLQLLLDHHIDQKTSINKILFDESVWKLLEQHFEGVTGAFSLEKKLGTYLFWGIPAEGKYRMQLWRKGNKLQSDDGSYEVELTPTAIKQAILNKELIPSVMLTFSVLACYYGLILGGGYEQTFYLTQTHKNYTAIMEAIGDQESVDAAAGLTTTNLVIPRPLMFYLNSANNARYPATGLDLYLYADGGKNWNRILDATKQTNLSLFIERTLPSIYREYCKDATNYETFSKLTERDIELFNGLDQKIPSVATI